MVKLAVFIDAENLSYRDFPQIIERVERLGDVALTAIYGDWQRPELQKWRVIAQTHDFKLRHQTNDPNAKNAADMKLIMDAMDVLHHVPVDAFCLVTNDADYVPLCDKLREADKEIIGIGYPHAASTLVRACDQFVFVRNGDPVAHTVPPKKKPAPSTKKVAVKPLITKAFALSGQDAHGWVSLSELGTTLSQMKKGFNTSHYGHGTLSKLLAAMPDFVKLRTTDDMMYARLLNPPPAQKKKLTKKEQLIIKAFASIEKSPDGWVTLTALGMNLRRVQTGFKPNQYGHATLSKMLRHMPQFIELRRDDDVMYARLIE